MPKNDGGPIAELLNEAESSVFRIIVNIFQGVPLPPITAAVTSVAAIKLSTKKGDRKVLYYSWNLWPNAVKKLSN